MTEQMKETIVTSVLNGVLCGEVENKEWQIVISPSYFLSKKNLDEIAEQVMWGFTDSVEPTTWQLQVS